MSILPIKNPISNNSIKPKTAAHDVPQASETRKNTMPCVYVSIAKPSSRAWYHYLVHKLSRNNNKISLFCKNYTANNQHTIEIIRLEWSCLGFIVLRLRLRSYGFFTVQNAHVSKPSSISPLAIRIGRSVCKLAAVGWDESLDLNPTPLLRYHFTGLAKIEMRRRVITQADISATLFHPEQVDEVRSCACHLPVLNSPGRTT